MKTATLIFVLALGLGTSVQASAQNPGTGYQGNGHEDPQTNGLLSYPELDSEHVQYHLGGPRHFVIEYAPEIDPATFKATLNGRDVSARFKARPGTRRDVYLKLRPGENELLLSVAGVEESPGVVRWDDDGFVVELGKGRGVGEVLTEAPMGVEVVPLESVLGNRE